MKPKDNKKEISSNAIISDDIKKSSVKKTKKQNTKFVVAIIVGLVTVGLIALGAYLYNNSKNENNNDNITFTTGEEYNQEKFVTHLENQADNSKPTNSSDINEVTKYYVLKVDSLSYAKKDKELAELYLTEITKAGVVLPIDQSEAIVLALQATAQTDKVGPLADHIIELLNNANKTSDGSVQSIIQEKLNYYNHLKETL